MLARPVAVICPHCGADLEVQLPVPMPDDEQKPCRAKMPEHYLPEPSRVSVTFDLAGTTIGATMSPLCPLAGARLSAPGSAVADAVDSQLSRARKVRP